MSTTRQTKPHVISADMEIGMFLHCRQCVEECPHGVSPKEFASLSVGFTALGVQVWCNRHEMNVVHIDFEGVKHPANVHSGKKRDRF